MKKQHKTTKKHLTFFQLTSNPPIHHYEYRFFVSLSLSLSLSFYKCKLETRTKFIPWSTAKRKQMSRMKHLNFRVAFVFSVRCEKINPSNPLSGSKPFLSCLEKRETPHFRLSNDSVANQQESVEGFHGFYVWNKSLSFFSSLRHFQKFYNALRVDLRLQ